VITAAFRSLGLRGKGALAVADPKILKGRGLKTMYQPRRHLLQVHTTNCMPITREKAAF